MLMTVLKGDVAYTQIYSMAKKSIVIIDDYVGVKTLASCGVLFDTKVSKSLVIFIVSR